MALTLVFLFEFYVCRNAKFTMLIYDKETQFVELSVFDADDVTKDDFLGSTTIELDKLPNGEATVIERNLQFIKHGTLKVSCTYQPVQKKIDGLDPFSKDILFSYSEAALSTDILIEDETIKKSESDSFSIPEDEVLSVPEATPTGMRNSIGKSFTKLAKLISPIQRMGNKSNADSSTPIPADSTASAGVLRISNIKCRNLVGSSSLTHSFKPYVSVSVMNKNAYVQKRNTAKKHNIRDPVFEESFNFVVDCAKMSSIHLKVMDDYKFMSNVMLGDVHIEVSKILSEYTSIEQNAFALENEYILSNVKNNESYLSCKLTWSPTDQG